MSFTNSDSFIPSFPIWMPFISFLCLIWICVFKKIILLAFWRIDWKKARMEGGSWSRRLLYNFRQEMIVAWDGEGAKCPGLGSNLKVVSTVLCWFGWRSGWAADWTVVLVLEQKDGEKGFRGKVKNSFWTFSNIYLAIFPEKNLLVLGIDGTSKEK